jgi:hypothetical protein
VIQKKDQGVAPGRCGWRLNANALLAGKDKPDIDVAAWYRDTRFSCLTANSCNNFLDTLSREAIGK